MKLVDNMSRIIEAEAGTLDFNGKLAVAQCIIDNDFNYDAFTKPADHASDESVAAAQYAVDGGRRFDEYQLLQFRSFKKYSDGDGHPDFDKIYSGVCPIPRHYLYLGKDGIEPWGHFYFGLTKPPDIKPTLKLTVIYDGSDGVNLRSDPFYYHNNIVGVLYRGGEFTVVDKTDDGDFYKLKSGLYITSRPDLVRVYEGKLCNFMVRVDIPDLNIRKNHGTDYIAYNNHIPMGSYTIVEVCKGKGAVSGWGLLKSYASNRDGWISLDYVERIK